MATNSLLQGQKELDDSSRVFRWNYVLMTALGLWPAAASDFRYFLNFGYYCYEMVLEYLDLFLFIDDFEHVLLNLTENMAFSPIFVRLLTLRLHNGPLGEVIAEARKDFDAKNYTEEERKTFVAYHVNSKIFMKLLITNTALTATSFYAKPILGQIGEIIEYFGPNGENTTITFLLPYRFYTFYELKDASTYFWTYGSQLPFVFVSGFGQSAGDCLMVTLVYHISGQMAILALRVASLDTKSVGCTQELQKVVKTHIKLLRGNIIRDLTYDYKKLFTRLFNNHTYDMYQSNDRMGKIVEEAFSATLLAHLIGATSLLCILGYQILVCLAIGEHAILVSFFAFIFLVLLVLYTFCTVGESLITESERLSQAFYNCDWYNMPKENASIILFSIARTQKPLQLTAGKFATFCLVTLTSSIKASMGYLSVLRTVM